MKVVYDSRVHEKISDFMNESAQNIPINQWSNLQNSH